jgi:hypothetical protein
MSATSCRRTFCCICTQGVVPWTSKRTVHILPVWRFYWCLWEQSWCGLQTFPPAASDAETATSPFQVFSKGSYRYVSSSTNKHVSPTVNGVWYKSSFINVVLSSRFLLSIYLQGRACIYRKTVAFLRSLLQHLPGRHVHRTKTPQKVFGTYLRGHVDLVLWG